MSFAASDIALFSLVRYLNIAIILCDALFFFMIYAFLLRSVADLGDAKSLPIILLAVALTLFKHIGNWGVFLITENVTDALNIRLSFLTAVSSIGIELLQHAVTIAIAYACARKPQRVRIMLVCGVMLAINLVSRLIGDIEYGAPASPSEILIMIAYYSADILLYGPVAYFSIKKIAKLA